MEWPFLQELESGELFSKVCREMILPQGVLYWMKRARQSAEINATVGVMRDERVDGPPGICYLKAVHAALAELDPEVVYPYAPVTGIEGLRKVWRDWLIRKGGAYLEGRSDLVCQPIVTQGLTNALFVAGRLFIDPDDVVVVPRKRWENYDLVFSGHLGARLGEFTATDRDGWCMESFAIALETFNPEQRIRIVVVNLPFNP
ncbi:aminotransferase class I/II-fold pyridoxal phosphate-dependent enzyme, partial [bacterium]|nr:aminotransferase class I/II-fold pyridoxal phosphate-dependent enzyme [candidate division CSSED10-310 bacterium]